MVLRQRRPSGFRYAALHYAPADLPGPNRRPPDPCVAAPRMSQRGDLEFQSGDRQQGQIEIGNVHISLIRLKATQLLRRGTFGAEWIAGAAYISKRRAFAYAVFRGMGGGLVDGRLALLGEGAVGGRGRARDRPAGGSKSARGHIPASTTGRDINTWRGAQQA